MAGMRRGPTRREFLGTSAIAGAGLALGWPATRLIAQPVAPADGLAFFVISDTHMLADSKSPGQRLIGAVMSGTAP